MFAGFNHRKTGSGALILPNKQMGCAASFLDAPGSAAL